MATPWFGRRFEFSVTARQLAAAAVLVLCTAFAGAYALQTAEPGEGPAASGWSEFSTGAISAGHFRHQDYATLARTVDELQRSVQEYRATWSPDAQSAFDRQLAVVNGKLERSLETCRKLPTDPACREQLLEAYREKLHFLEGFAKMGR